MTIIDNYQKARVKFYVGGRKCYTKYYESYSDGTTLTGIIGDVIEDLEESGADVRTVRAKNGSSAYNSGHTFTIDELREPVL